MNFFLTSPRPLLTFSWWRPISYRNQSNQWTGFYMISASVMKGLIKNVYSVYYRQLQHRPLPTRALIPTTYGHLSILITRDSSGVDYMPVSLKNVLWTSPIFLSSKYEKIFSCFCILNFSYWHLKFKTKSLLRY